jgi:hypothetical protein
LSVPTAFSLSALGFQHSWLISAPEGRVPHFGSEERPVKS